MFCTELLAHLCVFRNPIRVCFSQLPNTCAETSAVDVVEEDGRKRRRMSHQNMTTVATAVVVWRTWFSLLLPIPNISSLLCATFQMILFTIFYQSQTFQVWSHLTFQMIPFTIFSQSQTFLSLYFGCLRS